MELFLLALVQVPGVVETITCKDDPTQSYVSYVPKEYVKARKWPILYGYDPNAAGGALVDLYRDACEEVGWIVVGSNNSRNGPWEPIDAAMKAMWKDTHDRFSIDEQRVFASGFSGGARVSFRMANAYPNHVAGVIAMGAGLPSDNNKIGPKGMAIWLVCGNTDFNLKELEELEARLKRERWTYVRKTFPGDHTKPPRELAIESIRWMAKEKGLKPDPSAAKKAIEEGAKHAQDKAWRKAIAGLRKALQLGDAEQKKSALERLAEIEKAGAEQLDRAMAEKDKSKRKALLTKIKTDFDGLDCAGRASEELKSLK